MDNTISKRLTAIRQHMSTNNIDAFIIPSADEYLGEYIPEHNQRLRWISGFTGSAGTVIVLKDSATIFVDGRYTVQVRQQVSESEYNVLHLHDDPQPEWLAQILKSGSKVGIDSRMHTYHWYIGAKKVLDNAKIEIISLEENFIDLCWQGRPSAKINPIRVMDEKWTGKSSFDKRKLIGNIIEEKGADAALIFAADSSNWLLNIRGQDVPSLPIVLGFGVLLANGNMIFHLDCKKLVKNLESHTGSGVTFLSEQDFKSSLSKLRGKTVIVDPNTSNAFSILELEQSGARLIKDNDPVLLPKAAKNATEISGMQEAHIQDAVAEINFLTWFDQHTLEGNRPDEAFLADKLLEFRVAQPNFVEVSFDTISASGSNAAMCHYNHRNGQPANLPKNGVYLVDSGGQYECGTTDITRTVSVGNPDDEIKERFTLVLKGHIALDQIVFPQGTTGSQLDVLARQPLWMAGLDYDHGTGHGVGHFLSVHEGPQRISKKGNDIALVPGMVVSNEPGYYKDGSYGIRCENLLVVREAENIGQDGKKFLRFEALTFVPFDKKLIDTSLLTNSEIKWINTYHKAVLDKVGVRLNEASKNWLNNATQAI